jgi:hypothetical protein
MIEFNRSMSCIGGNILYPFTDNQQQGVMKQYHWLNGKLNHTPRPRYHRKIPYKSAYFYVFRPENSPEKQVGHPCNNLLKCNTSKGFIRPG